MRRNYDSVEAEYNESEKTFRECQNKYHQLNLSNIINEALLKRCDDESQYMSKPDKRLKDNYKDYQSYYREIINQENNLIKDNIPNNYLEKYRLGNLMEALSFIHFPENEMELNHAMRYLKYEELLNYCVLGYKKRRTTK